MVSQASSTAMAMAVRKITRRQGGVHGEGVSYTTDQPQSTTVRESGLRPGSLLLRHFCFTAIDRRRCHLIFQAQGHPNLQ